MRYERIKTAARPIATRINPDAHKTIVQLAEHRRTTVGNLARNVLEDYAAGITKFERARTEAEGRRQSVHAAAKKLFTQNGDSAAYDAAVKAADRQYFVAVIQAAEQYGIDTASYRHGLSIVGAKA